MYYIDVVFFCFFFFKQKTAYEMRISDWSSDVCSSDLGGLHADGSNYTDSGHTDWGKHFPEPARHCGGDSFLRARPGLPDRLLPHGCRPQCGARHAPRPRVPLPLKPGKRDSAMLNRILWAALVAGIVGGLATAVLQHFTTTPLILEAELYEGGEPAAAAAAAPLDGVTFGGARLVLVHGGSDYAEVGGEAWAPADGIERTLYIRSEEHTSELPSLMRISYAVFCLATQITYSTQTPSRYKPSVQPTN